MHARASALIKRLALAPHMEGGHFRRIHTAPSEPGTRPALSAIHFLLAAGERSRWHRVDADEVWHFVEGEPVELLTYREGSNRVARTRLGPLGEAGNDMASMQVVPAGTWQAARPVGSYALCTCVVVPAFEFSGFTLLDDPAMAARLRTLAPDMEA